MSKLLFGTDPEVFAVYSKDGKPYTLPPHFFRTKLGVEASADKRHPVFFQNDVSKFHEDGAAFEMAIKPSHNPLDLFNRIHECMARAEDTIISKFPEYCEPKLQCLPTVGFEVERWKNEGEDFRMSTEFGCDPDLDAWDMEKKDHVLDASKHPERYGGGHIHFSGSKFIRKDPILAIQVLSITAGIAAVAFSDLPELEKARTFLYGRPGKYRIQNYGTNSFGKDYEVGIEYRTPSNRWVSSWSIAEKVFEWGRFAFEELLPSNKVQNILMDVSGTATETILNANQSDAVGILNYISSEI
jgi:hypothetical protein